MTSKLPWSTVRRADGWWVIYPPYMDMGPYRSRAEAEDDARGVRRFEGDSGLLRQRELIDKRARRGEPDQLSLF